MEHLSNQTRGQRNNNPLNIRKGSNWKGLNHHGTDKDFCVFVGLEFGIRAALYILRKYIKTYKLCTVRQIISRWAPNEENNTEVYIQFVCKKIGVLPTDRIDWENWQKVCMLVKAMAMMESKMSLDLNQIVKVYSLLSK